MSKKVILIDGNSIAYRAFYALPLLNNDKGIHTNAIYGFAMMLTKLIEEEKPAYMLVAFDAGKTTFRHATYKEYKGGRQKTPPELSEQFPYIRKLVQAFGIAQYEKENYEADDIIGTLSKQAEQSGYDVRIVSGDKDLTQLASEKTTVYVTKKGVTEMDVYTPETIFEKYGIDVEQIIDMKGLMGDTSDNIPGVPGVGEKTAIKLLKEYKTVEKLLESIENIRGKKLKENLTTYKEQALMSKQLATILTEAPIDISLKDIAYKGLDEQQLIPLYKDLGFESFLEKMNPLEKDETSLKGISFTFVHEISEEMLITDSALYMEMIEDNYHQAPILGFGIKNENGNYYIPEQVALHSKQFVEWLENEHMKKYVYDAKRSIVALRKRGIEIRGISFDLLIASYLLNPSEHIHDLSDVAKNHGYVDILSDDQVYGKGAKRSPLTDEERAEHVVRKADAIFELKDRLITDLKENDQYDLFIHLESPLSHILADMESTGVKVDRNRLIQMGDEIAERLKKIEEKIYSLAGETFNINSPKQLAVILFEKLGLPPLKKTKTGYSTSADVLEKLQNAHPIIEEILHYRQLVKLQTTYIDGLLKVIHPETGKVYTRFNQALTQTGRLSSTEPNLQNIPIRLEEGRKIRQAFIPSEQDWVIFSADYSQIELRVLAHISGDEQLIEAFKQGMDIHTKTAMDVFHVNKDEVTSQMRRQAKAVNFGIVYGISDYGLSQNLHITRKEAGEFIQRYFESYPKVKEYMEYIVQEAKQTGYVTTLLNRRRYIPEITSRNYNVRSFAERTAMNTPIQGSAADIIKKAMIDMAFRLKKENMKTRLLLQVHDELIFEAPKEEIEKLKEIVPDCMEHAIELKVPLKVDYAYGPTWFDAK
ncbi:DNA polymerase I [Fervidibacillus halotolerans]|uniref:DNA polymerase I n=1 Tax=Fervidibacillus halotolerans TaxID=2980027 RepID=A0A9E8RWE1_9BACI|nr:DNA polymerase I [Fervidibacillus halotolerans]WAA11655.1 DNA polymerase I [Fervidibacillus halotolerans]